MVPQRLVYDALCKHVKMTDCASWTKLHTHHETCSNISLKKLFSESPNRFSEFSFEAAGLFIDYSKNCVSHETMDLLFSLAAEQQLPKAINALFSGEKINYSEKRAALHMALRLPQNEKLIIDGVDINLDVQRVLQKMARIAEQLEKKELLGYSGKAIDTILHVGVGGSCLGPTLYYQAMQAEKNATCHFFNEFDYLAIQGKLALCNPETTIVVIVSKSFTTQETVTIYNTIKNWLVAAAGSVQKTQSHFYAVTEKITHAKEQGFLPDHILEIWNWVGGRFSIWSAVSFSVILAFGIEHFRRFLSGAHQMDLHFQHAPISQNSPVIMALLAIWYNNFYHIHSKAIVPYSAQLSALPAYLQQLHMESLGKNVSMYGEKISYPTGRVIWGDTGPNSQHSFHQLLMQGSQMIPIDFILPLRDGNLNEYDIKCALNCLSQSQTLMQGYDACDYRTIEGNRPSTTILIERFSPETLGALIALYEHKVFVKSVIWGVNAFDQWGVERGKNVADELMACVVENTAMDHLDSSTRGLLEKIVQRF